MSSPLVKPVQAVVSDQKADVRTLLERQAVGMVTLAQLAASYLAQLEASLADRKQLHADLDALVAQVAGLRTLYTGALDRVALLEAKRQQLAGKNVALPLLAIGTTEITVSWGQNLGDASYQVALVPSANMPAAVKLTVNRTDAAFCIVTVKTTIAVPLGATFDAIAYRA